MDIKSLSIDEIKSISVKITCKHGDMNPKIGTGTLISDGVSFFVVTAAHCIYYKVKDKNGEERIIQYGIDEIAVESFFGGTATPITFLDVMDWNPDENKDYALLSVEKPKIDFDYSKVVRLGKQDVNNTQLFGFFSIREKGHLYNLEIVDEDSWIVKGVKEKQEEPETVLPGISGGGLLFKSEDTYYCLGYVKKMKDEHGHFDEVVVNPMSNFNMLGESTYRKSLYMPSVPKKEQLVVVTNDGQYDNVAYNVISRKISGAVWNKEDISKLFEELCEERANYISR